MSLHEKRHDLTFPKIFATGLRHDVLADDFLDVLAQRIETVGRHGSGSAAEVLIIFRITDII